MEEKHQGGCFCGKLRYETVGNPVRTAVCHCRYCQLRTGTAFGISVYFNTDQVTFNDAPFQTYSYDTEGGNTGVLTRCANCGTNVSWKMSLEALKDTIGIAGGTLTHPPSGIEQSEKFLPVQKLIFVGFRLHNHLKRVLFLSQ